MILSILFPLSDFHEALGSNYSPSLQGVIRRWKLAAASCEHYDKDLHVVLPFWKLTNGLVLDVTDLPVQQAVSGARKRLKVEISSPILNSKPNRP